MVPPVPIPNTVVKHVKAESTWLETAREDRKLPVKIRDIPCVYLVFLFAEKRPIRPGYPLIFYFVRFQEIF